MVQKLAEEYRPERIFLYGSYVYGQPHEHSDLDLLIVKDYSGPYWDEHGRVKSIIGDLGRSLPYLDIKLRTPARLRRRLELEDDFFIEVVRRGELLYKSPDAPPLDIDQIVAGSAMTQEERRLRRAREWLRTAAKDIETLNLLLEHIELDLAEPAAFHLQQIVEKYLKAYLISKGWRLQRTHNLGTLLNEAIKYDSGFGQFAGVCEKVGKWYFEVRYPFQDDEEDEDAEAPPVPPPAPPTMDEVVQAHQETGPMLENIRRTITPP
jgi:HEPN domain-containing protein/predicted nucleotidyltransferase